MSDIPRIKTCNVCKFSSRPAGAPANSPVLECRRFPPQAHPVAMPIPTPPGFRHENVSIFPLVRGDLWCGDWAMDLMLGETSSIKPAAVEG